MLLLGNLLVYQSTSAKQSSEVVTVSQMSKPNIVLNLIEGFGLQVSSEWLRFVHEQHMDSTLDRALGTAMPPSSHASLSGGKQLSQKNTTGHVEVTLDPGRNISLTYDDGKVVICPSIGAVPYEMVRIGNDDSAPMWTSAVFSCNFRGRVLSGPLQHIVEIQRSKCGNYVAVFGNTFQLSYVQVFEMKSGRCRLSLSME